MIDLICACNARCTIAARFVGVQTQQLIFCEAIIDFIAAHASVGARDLVNKKIWSAHEFSLSPGRVIRRTVKGLVFIRCPVTAGGLWTTARALP